MPDPSDESRGAPPATVAPPAIARLTDLRPIGRGGFSTVYAAKQLLPERTVALKVFAATLTSPSGAADFEREVNLHGRLSSHPSIVTIYWGGLTDDRRPYLVMELYPGGNATEWIAQHERPFEEVLAIGIQIASALESAHRMGVVHRDVKPANILFSGYGRPGLTDFGLATVDEEVGAQAFTPSFVAPEILDGGAGSPQSDVYGLGATLFALAAGRPPFSRPGESIRDVVASTLRDSVDFRDLEAKWSPLVPVIRRALAREPSQRPHSALALARELQGIENELGLRPTPIELADERPSRPTFAGGPALSDDWGDTFTRVRFRSEIAPLREALTPASGRPDVSVQSRAISELSSETISRAQLRQAVLVEHHRATSMARSLGLLTAFASVLVAISTVSEIAGSALSAAVGIGASLVAALSTTVVSDLLFRVRRRRQTSRARSVGRVSTVLQIAYVDALTEQLRLAQTTAFRAGTRTDP